MNSRAQAQARVKELYEERDWQKARDADTPEAYQAFLKQYPEGKWTEEARIRVENFTLAQTPPGSGTAGSSRPSHRLRSRAGHAGRTSRPPGRAARRGQTRRCTGEASRPRPPPATPPSTPPSASRSKSSGAYGVQLGAFKSGAAAANRRWARLQKEYPQLLAGMSSKVVPKKTATRNALPSAGVRCDGERTRVTSARV